MAAAPSHNPTAVTKKVYFDISIGGQPEGEALAGHRVRSCRMQQKFLQQCNLPFFQDQHKHRPAA
jgi:hypothetical protein